jgi:hypothetical protein
MNSKKDVFSLESFVPPKDSIMKEILKCGRLFHDPDFILIEDWAYGKIERLDRYQSQKQSDVIRLKDNVQLAKSKTLRRKKMEILRC